MSTFEAPPAAGQAWHTLPWQEVARRLKTDPDKGLAQDEARRRPAAAPLEEAPAWRLALALFAAQWKGSVILILCVSAAVLWGIGHRNDAIGIAISIVFAVALGFLTDFRSQRALAALKSLNAPSASVLRDGVMVEIPAARLVPGDIVILRGGAVVPADGRLIRAGELSLQESALTGESAAVAKGPEPCGPEAPLAERACMAYAGTTALTGLGRMIVTEVGPATELGRIGRLVESYRKEETPLEVQVEALGRRLGILIAVLCAATTALGLLLGQSGWEMIETGILLAIAAIPEGLPAVNTAALAGGVRRMVRARAVVRRLSAVETLGCVDVVCADKTGTLTQNVMRAAVVCLPGRRLEVSGSGYAPEGRFWEGPAEAKPREDEALQRLLWIAAVCNNASLESHEGWHVHGSPTEGALLVLAAQGGVDADEARRRFKRLAESAFSSERKRMSVVVEDGPGGTWTLVKGSTGSLLPRCDRILGPGGERPLSEAEREDLRLEARRLGAQGLRVLALASRRGAAADGDPEAGLVWSGMVGLLDPPRPGALEAVRALAGAGIRTIMVTGDQKDTAASVAARLGLPSAAAGSRDAAELADILRRDAWEELERIVVFARVAPEDKLKLVDALKSRGHVVAMTGDGINDAPALKAADIGVAMGSAAADVAKEAADIVITDADYSTLTAAVAEGRRIYSSLQRSARYLLLCSLGNIGLMTGAVLLRLPLVMTALQLLWLNLVIHIFPAVALATAPNPRDFMKEPPRRREAELLGWSEILAVAPRSLVVAAAALAVFASSLGGGLAFARTSAMSALGLALLAQTFVYLAPGRLTANLREAGWSVWLALAASLAILGAMLYLPPLGALLGTTPLTPRQWLAPAAALLGSLAALALLDRRAR